MVYEYIFLVQTKINYLYFCIVQMFPTIGSEANLDKFLTELRYLCFGREKIEESWIAKAIFGLERRTFFGGDENQLILNLMAGRFCSRLIRR